MRPLLVLALILLIAGCRQSNPDATTEPATDADDAATDASPQPAFEQADCENKLMPQLFASDEAVLLHAKKTELGCDMDVDFLKQDADEVKEVVVQKLTAMGYVVENEQPARRGVRVVLRSDTAMVSILIRSKDAVALTTKDAQGTAYIHWYHERPTQQ